MKCEATSPGVPLWLKKGAEVGKKEKKIMAAESEKERAEILLEHMDRKIDVVLEGHQVLRRDIAEVREEARRERKEIKNQLSLVATNLREKIETVDRKVDKNREEIVKNREAIEKNTEKIEVVDDKVSKTLAKAEDHDQRISRLEVAQ